MHCSACKVCTSEIRVVRRNRKRARVNAPWRCLRQRSACSLSVHKGTCALPVRLLDRQHLAAPLIQAHAPLPRPPPSQLPLRYHLPAMLLKWATMTAGGCLVDRQLLGSATAGWHTYAWSFLCIVVLSTLVVAWLEGRMRCSFAAAWAATDGAGQHCASSCSAQGSSKAGSHATHADKHTPAPATATAPPPPPPACLIHGAQPLPPWASAGAAPQQAAPQAAASQVAPVHAADAAPAPAPAPVPSWRFNMSRMPGGLVSLSVKLAWCL
jgi:hypothetical protein